MFTEKCTPCHLKDGGGSIGPNLTDDFWIHGNQPGQIYTVIDKGVLDKGMINWGATLKPDQMQSLLAYVLTLHGTRPATPKEPQGDKLEEWQPGAAPR
jgi:cytochrome c oxidase cbb3-type subunit 3